MLNSIPSNIATAPTPLQTFLNYNENTMNQYTNASVGALLLELANKYLPNISGKTEQSDIEQNAATIEKYVDESIVALKAKLTSLKKYLKTSDDELNAVFVYIDHLIQQPLNELDNLIVFKNGKSQTHQISLKQVLALVFRALTDKKVFESTKPKNAKAEKDQDENENDRLLTLYNTLNKLRKGKMDGTNFCHTGVRNDITCSLNGVYPDVRIIEQIDTAISMVLQDFVLERLTEKKPTQQFQLLFHQLRDNVSSEETSDFETWVTDNRFKKEAKECLDHFCLENGLNPDDTELAKIINNNLLGLSSLPAPVSLHPQAPYLETLVTFAYTDKTLPHAARTQLQAELNSLTSFEDIEKKGLLHRLKAAQLWRTVKTYENIPIIGAEEKDFADAVKALLNFLPSYFQQPNHASDIENLAIQQHIATITAHEKKKPNQDFIAIFFELWLNAESTEAKITLRNRLLAEKSKLLLSDAQLNHFFALQAENNIVSIEPYHINLILLQAMLSPVTDWTPTFHACLTRIIAFIQNNFKENASPAAPSLIAATLRRNSYPDRFLKWFLVLQKLYLKVKQNEGPHFKVASNAIQVWMLDETKKLNLQNWLAIIEVVGNHIGQVINSNAQLCLILGSLDPNAQSALINALGSRIKIFFQYRDDLDDTLQILNLHAQLTLINVLGTHIQRLIESVGGLAEILSELDPTNYAALIHALGDTFKIIINDYDHLLQLLEKLAPYIKLAFINIIGTHVQTIVKNGDQLAGILKTLDHNARLPFINNVLGAQIQTIVKNGDQLAEILKTLDHNAQLTLINSLGAHVQTIIKDACQLTSLLEELDPNAQLALINSLGTHIQTIIQDECELAMVLEELEKNIQTQLCYLILLDKKELIDRINRKSTAMTIYADNCRFAKGKTPFDASRAILENYVQPELLGVFKLGFRDTNCLKVVREALNDKTTDSIDALLTRISTQIPLARIKECDTSLYQRLQYVCALGNESLDKYVATVQHTDQFNVGMG